MKKMALILATALLSTNVALAFGPNNPTPMMRGYGAGNYPTQNINETKARDMIKQFLDTNNMKEYKILNIQKVQVPRGEAYYATVENQDKQQYQIHVNPWGYVVGPFALPK